MKSYGLTIYKARVVRDLNPARNYKVGFFVFSHCRRQHPVVYHYLYKKVKYIFLSYHLIYRIELDTSNTFWCKMTIW